MDPFVYSRTDDIENVSSKVDTQRMKITYLHQHFKTLSMSGGTRSFEFAKRLASNGHDVNVISAWTQSYHPPSKIQMIENFRVHWIMVSYDINMSFIRRIWSFLLFAARASLVAVRLRADVIFATSTPLTIIIPGFLASKLRRAPLVFEIRDIWPEAPISIGAIKNPLLIKLAEKLESFAYSNSNQIITLAPRMSRHIVKWGFKKEDVTLVPNACDLELFSTCRSKSGFLTAKEHKLIGKKIFLYCGTVGLVNGLSFLVDVAKFTHNLDKSIAFVVVGTGNDLLNVTEKAQAAGVLNVNFFLLPPVSKLEVPLVLADADIASNLVIPNPELRADSANKFFDALASGTPVCMNMEGPLADLIVTKSAGLVVPQNASEAATLITTYLSDTESLREAKSNALELGKSYFDRNKLAMQIEQVLIKAVVCASRKN